MSGFDRVTSGLEWLFYRVPALLLTLALIAVAMQIISLTAHFSETLNRARFSGIAYPILNIVEVTVSSFHLPCLMLGLASACAKLTGNRWRVYRALPLVILIVAIVYTFVAFLSAFAAARTGLASISLDGAGARTLLDLATQLAIPALLAGVATLAWALPLQPRERV